MCRLIPSRQFNFAVDENLMEQIREQADPEIWEARDKQAGPIVKPKAQKSAVSPKRGGMAAAASQEPVNMDGMFMLKIKYGNKHRLVDNAPLLKNGRRRNHEWTVFV